ncbi:MAG: SDR family oxidoreductase [Candidatus Omnitrophica bacterium]|nr:SDR family oxidoreductase [Candidatus Omnitrophota bacterium]
MTKPLKNKIAVVTGGSRGIGRAICLRLAEMGADIVVNYVRNQEAADETVKAIAAQSGKAVSFQANVGDSNACEALIDYAVQEFGGVDILVHNAAIGAFKPVHQLRPNQWDLSFEINTKAFLILVKKVIPLMEKKGEGNVVAISSLGAHRFLPSYGAIGISKAALETLVKYLAVELAPKKIRVNCVSGGAVETDALRSYPDFNELKKDIVRKTPAGRMGEPDDLARVVAFLLTPESSWICGQTLIADGGLSLV